MSIEPRSAEFIDSVFACRKRAYQDRPEAVAVERFPHEVQQAMASVLQSASGQVAQIDALEDILRQYEKGLRPAFWGEHRFSYPSGREAVRLKLVGPAGLPTSVWWQQCFYPARLGLDGAEA